MRIFVGSYYTDHGWQKDQTVEMRDGQIVAVYDGCHEADRLAAYLVPGFFDTHNHGGEGFDATSLDREALARFLLRSASCGVTDILITLLTSDVSVMEDELAFIRRAMDEQAAGTLGGSRIRGVHLEGPFLNSQKAGAQELSAILAPDVSLFEARFAPFSDIIRLVTLAPEQEGADELIAYLLSRGIPVQAGHTAASYEEAEVAFSRGVRSVCHTFNACAPLHHREPGIVGAALLDERVYCEAIADLVHLHPGTLRLMARCCGADRMVLVSDSTMPKGLPDGRYWYANSRVIVKNGERRCENGALNGGLCYLDESVRRLVGWPDSCQPDT